MRLSNGLWMVAAFSCACSQPDEHLQTWDGANDDDSALPGKPGAGSDGTSPGAPTTCVVSGAPGTVGRQIELEPSAGAAVLAADRDGNVFYTAANALRSGSTTVYAQGVTKLNDRLEPVFAYPHGRVVAVDARGNAYVAGSFSQPTDFGTGVLQPTGNVDVFVVKLSPTGDVLFATHLGLCGGGAIRGIAVDTRGRIAVSGDAMGTAVLDGAGALLFQLPPAGYVAFDTHGRLIIGGSFAGVLDLTHGHRLTTTGTTDVDAFLVRYDETGVYDFSIHLGDTALPVDVPGFGVVDTPRPQALMGVATGPDDEIAMVGGFMFEMDLFGTTLTLPPTFPSGELGGSFIAKLEASGTVVFSRSTPPFNAGVAIGGLTLASLLVDSRSPQLPGTAIAVDATGDLVVSSQTPGDPQAPFAFPQLTKYEGTTGGLVFGVGNGSGATGYGLGVAVAGCGNIVWADFENTPDPGDPHIFISTIAP